MRWPENEPTDEDLGYLKQLKSEDIEELVRVKAYEVRYLKQVKRSQEYLYCHGDPTGEKDPTGGTKEDWKAGDIHGAFEIISLCDATNAKIRH